MNRSANEIWEAVLGALELQVTKANYQTWLKDTFGHSCEDDYFTIGVPNTFAIEWLDKRLSHLIAKTLAHVVGRPMDIRFQVSQVQQEQSGTSPDKNGITKTPCFNPRYKFSSFIVGSSNRLAHAAALGVAENLGAVYNPLFIYGGVGLGKTHLLHAIGHFAENAGKQVIYVTAEQFTNEFIAGIRERTTDSFRNKYRGSDVLLIDDIQFIAGKEQTQEGLFHTFNDLHTANRQIILSSDRPPKALALLEDRLRSRFEWGLIVDVQPPDFETRVAILQARVEGIGTSVPYDVLQLIARRVQNNIRELEGALNRVLAYARLTNATVTPELADSSLIEIASSESRRTLSVEIILNTVAKYFGLTTTVLLSARRDKSIAFARQVAMFLMREEMELSWTNIGRDLGGRDHSTILHGYNKIASEIESSSALRRDMIEIRETLYSHMD